MGDRLRAEPGQLRRGRDGRGRAHLVWPRLGDSRRCGTVIFFSMATSFTSAALGAEGVGKDVQMIVGNGYVPHHAELTLELLRRHDGLRKLFEQRYV